MQWWMVWRGCPQGEGPQSWRWDCGGLCGPGPTAVELFWEIGGRGTGLSSAPWVAVCRVCSVVAAPVIVPFGDALLCRTRLGVVIV